MNTPNSTAVASGTNASYTLPAQTKERPILFSGSMVRAILDGKKTQTRRIVKGVSVMIGLLRDEMYRDGRQLELFDRPKIRTGSEDL